MHAKAVRDAAKAAAYLSLAEELTSTCRQMYAQTATGTHAAFASAPPAALPDCVCIVKC